MDVFRGKIAVATGGSRGIGKAVALALSDAGAKVAVAVRKKDLLDKGVGEIQSTGGRMAS